MAGLGVEMITRCDDVLRRLVKALGLPANTKSFVLRAGVDQIVSIECEYYPEAKDLRPEEMPGIEPHLSAPKG
jgi:hypothetical protein